jgi:phospholipid N-methyltransferase
VSGNLTFLKTFARHPSQVGAVAPSGAGLVRTMTDWFEWDTARTVVEYGPGTGVFTEAILSRRHPDARFFAIEKSPELVEWCRRRCPTADVVVGDVARVERLCRERGITHVDAIVCGLPWASFSASLQEEILQATLRVLRPGGQFATFAYWQGVALPAGLRFSRRLRRSFQTVERSPTAWRNLPPAFVYRCRK